MSSQATRIRSPEVMRVNGTAFNLAGWIENSMGGDMGSVGNKEVFAQSDHIFMIVKGPNARNDFHIDPYDEIFYQLQGTIHVHTMDESGKEQIAEVKEGEVMLIAAYTPHSPRRPPGSLGLVVERPRGPDELDSIVWYCDECGDQIHRVEMACQDIETQLTQVLDAFNADEALRTCGACGSVLPDPTQS